MTSMINKILENCFLLAFAYMLFFLANKKWQNNCILENIDETFTVKKNNWFFIGVGTRMKEISLFTDIFFTR